ncbi:MAG: HAD family hydrolase [Bacteroidales bacterium]|nr:HAD family hydrolase [Bacteroidales bacterium]
MSVSVIFDMDGTLVDNAKYHQQAFDMLCDRYERPRIQVHNFMGQTNHFIMGQIFRQKLTKEETQLYAAEKEANYRELFGKEIKPVEGLMEWLETLSENNIPMAMATSAPKENVDFVLDRLFLRKYFAHIVDESMIEHGKPHPEIFLKAAQVLSAAPENCVVFEDALFGVEAGKKSRHARGCLRHNLYRQRTKRARVCARLDRSQFYRNNNRHVIGN